MGMAQAQMDFASIQYRFLLIIFVQKTWLLSSHAVAKAKNFFVVWATEKKITKHTPHNQTNGKMGRKSFQQNGNGEKNQLRLKRSKNDGIFANYVFR